MSISKIFIPNFACVLKKNERKHIEQNFHSVARVMSRGGTWGAGGIKTSVWGFAMAPHRLGTLVLVIVTGQGKH